MLEKFFLPISGLMGFVPAQASLDLSSISSSLCGASGFCLPLYRRIPSLPGHKLGAGKEEKGAKAAIHSNYLIKVDHQRPKTNKKVRRTFI